jgi:DNA-binding NarL/FixJ family response regulator
MKLGMVAMQRDSTTRASLRALAMRAENEAVQLMGADARAMLALWQGLVDGEWGLVDRFETDGRRYFVLAENAPEMAVRVSLSAQERHLITLAAAGFSDKTAADALGVMPSIVPGILKRTLMKMGLQSRAELVRLVRALAVDPNK